MLKILSVSDNSTFDDDISLLYRGNYREEDGTKWKSAEPTQSVRTRRRNSVTHFPGSKGDARQANTLLEDWQCFLQTTYL